MNMRSSIENAENMQTLKKDAVDDVLKETLRTSTEPDEELIQKTMAKLDSKENGTIPDTSSKNSAKSKRLPAAAAIFASVLAVSSITVAASWRYLSAKDVASHNQDAHLEAALEEATPTEREQWGETQVAAGIRVTFLGFASAEEVSDFQTTVKNKKTGYSQEYTSGSRALFALEYEDGTPFEKNEIPFYMSPYVDGVNPYGMSRYLDYGGGSGFAEDGILYLTMRTDLDIGCLACETSVYVGLCDGISPNPKEAPYLYDPETGKISRNENCYGMNVLFEIKADPSRANPEKANRILTNMGVFQDKEKACEEVWALPAMQKVKALLTEAEFESYSAEMRSFNPWNFVSLSGRVTPEQYAESIRCSIWSKLLTSETLDEYAKPLEDSTRTLTPDENSGRYRYSYQFPGDEILSTSIPKKYGKNAQDYTIINVAYKDLLEDSTAMAVTYHPDGTVTVTIYQPSEAYVKSVRDAAKNELGITENAGE